MKAGYRGTFVIPWAQTEVDGLTMPEVDTIGVGAVWRWTGRAVRVDDPRDILVLEGSEEVALTHSRAARQVQRPFGDPNPELRREDNLDVYEPLFRSGFEVTDGHEKYQVTLVDLESSQYSMVLFVGALPPPEQDLWVVSSNIAPLVRRTSDGLGGIICFVPGTRIRTPTGPILVEELAEGDRICTKDSGPQAVRWIGSRRMTGGRLIVMPQLRPIRLRAHALADGEPDGDLIVSPDHRVLLKGPVAQALFDTPEVLVAARDLINDRTVRVMNACREVTYVHLMLDAHQIVWANGVECESFHPAGATLENVDAHQRQALLDRFPDICDDPYLYGDYARRNLTRSEAAILAHGIFRGYISKSAEAPLAFGASVERCAARCRSRGLDTNKIVVCVPIWHHGLSRTF